MEITDFIKFSDYVNYVRSSKNVIASLTNILARLHDLPPEDFGNTMGRMGRIWTLTNKDTGYLVKIIWNTASESIAGSHLNYIQAIIQKKPNKSADVNKFLNQKYGHMVQR